jgi:phosphotriesterase-related protein
MSTVHTVQGPIDAGELGFTLIHEHVRARDEAVALQWPAFYDEDAEMAAATQMTGDAMGHGVKTIVDPTAMLLGRDVRFMKAVSDATGIQIVPCTGIYTYEYLPLYFQTRSPDQIAEHFVRDIEEGIQGTEIRAQFLKCAADEPGITENVEKVHRACARASLQTGAPIMAHSRPASDTAPRQIEILTEEGVDPAKIQIAHMGDTDDLDQIERVLDTGVWIGLDRYGIEMYLPMENRNRTAAELLRRGYANRLFIAQDACATLDWFPPETVEQLVAAGAVKDWTMSLIFTAVLPVLRDEGVLDESAERTIFEENPVRWLTG